MVTTNATSMGGKLAAASAILGTKGAMKGRRALYQVRADAWTFLGVLIVGALVALTANVLGGWLYLDWVVPGAIYLVGAIAIWYIASNVDLVASFVTIGSVVGIVDDDAKVRLYADGVHRNEEVGIDSVSILYWHGTIRAQLLWAIHVLPIVFLPFEHGPQAYFMLVFGGWLLWLTGSRVQTWSTRLVFKGLAMGIILVAPLVMLAPWYKAIAYEEGVPLYMVDRVLNDEGERVWTWRFPDHPRMTPDACNPDGGYDSDFDYAKEGVCFSPYTNQRVVPVDPETAWNFSIYGGLGNLWTEWFGFGMSRSDEGDAVPPVPDAKPDERRGTVDDRNFLDEDFGRVRAGWETPENAWIKYGDVISVTLEGPGCFWTNLEEDVLLLDQTMFPYVTFSLIKGEGQRPEQVKPRPIEIEARPSDC